MVRNVGCLLGYISYFTWLMQSGHGYIFPNLFAFSARNPSDAIVCFLDTYGVLCSSSSTTSTTRSLVYTLYSICHPDRYKPQWSRCNKRILNQRFSIKKLRDIEHWLRYPATRYNLYYEDDNTDTSKDSHLLIFLFEGVHETSKALFHIKTGTRAYITLADIRGLRKK